MALENVTPPSLIFTILYVLDTPGLVSASKHPAHRLLTEQTLYLCHRFDASHNKSRRQKNHGWLLNVKLNFSITLVSLIYPVTDYPHWRVYFPSPFPTLACRERRRTFFFPFLLFFSNLSDDSSSFSCVLFSWECLQPNVFKKPMKENAIFGAGPLRVQSSAKPKRDGNGQVGP